MNAFRKRNRAFRTRFNSGSCYDCRRRHNRSGNSCYETAAGEERATRRAERMEVVGHLTGGIVHDFNNIFTVITGTIEVLAERSPTGRIWRRLPA